MVKTVLTFGDSNTYGTPPAHARGENQRFGPDVRWPCVMGKLLGDNWHVIEAGLPGRTTCLADPVMGAHMDGQLGLRIALEGHGPIDLLTIMLGTNDAQTHHARSAAQIVGGIASLISIAKTEPYQTRHGGFDILIIAPPATQEIGTYRDSQMGACAKSKEFPDLMGALAAHWGLPFFDAAAHIDVSPIDGVHFSAESHQTLGARLAEKVRSL